MVNENIIPKTETVYELKEEYKVPSFEEFMKTYQSNKASEFLAEAEYQDQALNGPRYGPGNTQSTEERTKKALSIGLAVSYFTPLSAITVPLSIGLGTTGLTAGIVGKLSDNEELTQAGNHVLGVVADSVTLRGDFKDSGMGDLIKYKTKN
jgi:hypothetical protein